MTETAALALWVGTSLARGYAHARAAGEPVHYRPEHGHALVVSSAEGGKTGLLRNLVAQVPPAQVTLIAPEADAFTWLEQAEAGATVAISALAQESALDPLLEEVAVLGRNRPQLASPHLVFVDDAEALDEGAATAVAALLDADPALGVHVIVATARCPVPSYLSERLDRFAFVAARSFPLAEVRHVTGQRPPHLVPGAIRPFEWLIKEEGGLTTIRCR